MNTVVNQIINSNNNNSNKLMQMSTATDNVTAAASILTGLLKPRLLQQYSNNIVLDNPQTNKVVRSYLESNMLQQQQQSDINEQIEENLQQQQQNELIKTDDSSMPLHEIDEKQNNAEDIEDNSKLIDNNPIIMNDVLPEQHDNNLMNSNEIVQDVPVIVNNNNIDENLELIIEPENLNIKQKTDQDEVNEDQQIDNIVINFQENDDDDDDDEEDSAIKLNTINY